MHLDWVITFLLMYFINIYHTGIEMLCGQILIGNGINTEEVKVSLELHLIRY
jgi:hypothetical protein